MPEFTKTELEQVLKNIIEGLEKVWKGGKPKHHCYVDLYPTRLDKNGYKEHILDEEKLAEKAIEHPELHPLMVKLVEGIIRITNRWELWWYEDEQAGSLMTLALALHDKKYCQLFADCLANQDLDHAVNQNEYIVCILDKWGLCKETAAILRARLENEGQDGPEFVADYVEKYGVEEMAKYGIEVEEDEDWEDWEEDDEEDEEDEEDTTGVGWTLTIQHKRSLESFVVYWDEGYTNLVVRRFQPGVGFLRYEEIVYEYGSYQEVVQAAKDLKARSEEQGYGLLEESGPALAKRVAAHTRPVPPADVLALFAPKGKRSNVELIIENEFKGRWAKPIPCKKILLYKGVHDFVVLMADGAGCRIRNALVFEGDYLWTYASEDEMNQGLEGLKQEYMAKGYDTVTEEIVDYAFDYFLEADKDDADVLLESTRSSKEAMRSIDRW